MLPLSPSFFLLSIGEVSEAGVRGGIISGLSPESSLIVNCTWQVFWLGVYFNAFPFFKQWRRLKLLFHPPYSYQLFGVRQG